MNELTVSFTENPFGINYKVFTPKDTPCDKTAKTDLPLLVYLHGAGERGEKADHLFRHGVPKLIKEGAEIPAVVLCPQCPAWAVWDNVVEKVKGVIDTVVQQYGIQKDRVCITGSSMGGYGTWMMAMTYGNFFSAAAPVAGGGIAWRASNIVSTPVYAVHGAKDSSVLPVCSQLMVDSLNGFGGTARLVLLPDKGHNDGIDYAYRNTDLIDWLLSQCRTDFTPPVEPCSEYF